MSLHANERKKLNNNSFDKRNLRRAMKLDQRLKSIKISLYGSNKFVMVSALADTSAQSNLWGWKNFQDAGIGKNNYFPLSITFRSANKTPITFLGVFRATVVRMSPNVEVISCNDVSDSITASSAL